MWRILPSSCIRLQRAKRLFKRRARVDAMKLIEIDALELQPAQAHLDALNEIAGAAHVFGLRRTLARDSAFGGDDHASRIRRQRFADQPLGDLRPIGVGGVDESDAKLNGSPQHARGFFRIAGSPHAPSPTRRMVP